MHPAPCTLFFFGNTNISPLTERKGPETTGATDEDLFDVALENDTKPGAHKGPSDGKTRSERRGAVSKRQKKDEKFGFGGKKRFSKSGDAVSSGDMRAFGKTQKGGSGGGGAPKRLGKSRRSAGKSS